MYNLPITFLFFSRSLVSVTPRSGMHYTWNQKGLAKGESLSIYDHQLNRQTREKYQVGITINEGRFASVKICKGKMDEKEYLLRVISKANVFWHDDLILKEIRIMTKLRHQNIMQVVDQWESSDEMCLVMEQIEVTQFI